MYDPDAPSSKRALAEYRKPFVYERLIEKAKKITDSAGDAEPLLEDAMMLVLDPDKYPWNYREHPFLKHMGLVMRHVWDGWLRSARVRHELVTDDVLADKKTPTMERFIGAVSREPRADDELHRLRMLNLYRQLAEQLLGGLDVTQRSHFVARRVLELGCQGIVGIKEQARLVPCSRDEVRAAHELLRYHGRRIRAEWDEKEQSRMKELRERTRNETRAGDPP
jgi:hypothetical protein